MQHNLRGIQVLFCATCKNKSKSLMHGVICKLTENPATFEDKCPDYSLLEDSKELPYNSISETIEHITHNWTILKNAQRYYFGKAMLMVLLVFVALVASFVPIFISESLKNHSDFIENILITLSIALLVLTFVLLGFTYYYKAKNGKFVKLVKQKEEDIQDKYRMDLKGMKKYYNQNKYRLSKADIHEDLRKLDKRFVTRSVLDTISEILKTPV